MRIPLMLSSLLAATLCAGCSLHFTCVPSVAPDVVEAINSVACSSRSHVHLFFLQGHAPVDCAGLEDLKNTAHDLGFDHAWYAPCWYEKKIRKEIARISRDDPHARFVLVAHGHGVATAARLAESVAARDVHFDLMLCLGESTARPKNVSRMVTVLASGFPHDETDDVVFVDTLSCKLPGHPRTADVLARELLGVAAPIPAAEDLPPRWTPTDPTPQLPVMPKETDVRDEWDFLLPTSSDVQPVHVPGTVPERKRKS